MASRFIQDLSIDTGTIANIIDYPRNGLKVSLNAIDYEAERVRKEAEEQKKGEFKEENEDVPHGDERDTGDTDDISGDGDKVENSDDAEETAVAKSSDDAEETAVAKSSDDAEETAVAKSSDDAEEAAVAKSSDEPMEGDEIKKSEESVEVLASDVNMKGNELDGDELKVDEIKGGDVIEENDETDEGVEVEEAEVGDEPIEGDDPMGDDEEVSDESEDDQSEGSDESDYDEDTDDDDEGLEGVAANASEQVDGVELANIGKKVREESDEEESDSDQDSDFEEEQPKTDKGFIKVLTLSQTFGIIIQGSGATLSPETHRKAMSGKYITIQLHDEPNIPKHSNVVIELQPEVCELFGKEAYNAMLNGDWTKMVKVAKKNGCPYPEILNKLRASQGKAPIKIKQRN